MSSFNNHYTNLLSFCKLKDHESRKRTSLLCFPDKNVIGYIQELKNGIVLQNHFKNKSYILKNNHLSIVFMIELLYLNKGTLPLKYNNYQD